MAELEVEEIAADQSSITSFLIGTDNFTNENGVKGDVIDECLDILVQQLGNNSTVDQHGNDFVLEGTDVNADTSDPAGLSSTINTEDQLSQLPPERNVVTVDSDAVSLEPFPNSDTGENSDVGENSDADENRNVPLPTVDAGSKKRGRKRTRRPETWERNIRRTNRQKGKEYVNSKGNQVPAKVMADVDCSRCYAKCSDKIEEDSRRQIFEHFWSLEDNNKSIFYAKFTEKIVKQRKRTKATGNRKDYSFLYFLESHDVRHRVCKKFFLATLGISQSRINYFHSNLTNNETGTPKARKQGKFKKKNVPENELKYVRDHISSFPVIESHYCREKTKRQYLEQSLNLSMMYDLYKEQCTENGRGAVKAHKYRQIFNEEFNLGFIKPKSDRCDACEQQKMEIQKGKTFSEHETAQIERHRFLKSDAYEERQRDRKSETAVLCFDLENVISLPRANVSNFYYRRKLSVYNLTVHCSIDKHVYCCIGMK